MTTTETENETDDRHQTRVRDQETRALIAELGEEIPGFRIAYKDDPPSSMPWLHRVLHWLGRRFVPEYATRFTTVLYPVVYFPEGTRDEIEAQPSLWYSTLRHERVHLRDIHRHPLWMPLSYAFVLPFGVTLRAWWELRAYAVSMRVQIEENGELDDDYFDGLVTLFSGRSYVFMLWPKGLARRVLGHLRERVETSQRDGTPLRLSFRSDFLRPLLGR